MRPSTILAAVMLLPGATGTAEAMDWKSLKPMSQHDALSLCAQPDRAKKDEYIPDNCVESEDWGSPFLASDIGRTKLAIRAIPFPRLDGSTLFEAVFEIEIQSRTKGSYAAREYTTIGTGRSKLRQFDNRYTGPLDKDDVALIAHALEEPDFWTLPHYGGESCFDGDPLIIEAAEAGRHNMITLDLACNRGTGLAALHDAIMRAMQNKPLPKRLKEY